MICFFFNSGNICKCILGDCLESHIILYYSRFFSILHMKKQLNVFTRVWSCEMAITCKISICKNSKINGPLSNKYSFDG